MADIKAIEATSRKLRVIEELLTRGPTSITRVVRPGSGGSEGMISRLCGSRKKDDFTSMKADYFGSMHKPNCILFL